MKTTPELVRQHLIDTQPGIDLLLLQLPERDLLVPSDTPVIEALPRIIIRQMLSLKASATIIGRVEQKAKDLEAGPIAYLPVEALTLCGVSRSKAAAINSVAHCHRTQPDRIAAWSQMASAELIKDVTRLKGVGPWTASILAMFHFAHEDLFPIQDSSLRKAMSLLKDQDILIIPERAQPYRSYLACYLWDMLDQARL
ncbi:3-methyladenine DNA glycosylase [Idiomarina sp. HP20-50]|uniref:DNA-3-methyladenine glycosylase family protein n=1 Tax=Idiomarina sp. HP20-50 TaxID=3070813 RepID=UPI00294ADD54|nr:3-methyladenine DNA glycosylase [Idiomarina sp. HP20-50]MDV6315166.1 3-methyladenine DNA glycosylase [Idiomarina sp. HP20-50]